MTTWQNYEISSGAYLLRADQLLSMNLRKGDTLYPQTLFYAALEIRIAIERVLWESIVLSKYSDGALDTISKSEFKLYKPSEIWRTLLDVDPLLEKRIAFLKIVCRVDPSIFKRMDELIPDPVFELPNIKLLDELYGRIGAYLHALEKQITTINDSAYWQKFLELLERSIGEVHKTARSHIHFTPSGRAIEAFDRLVNGATEEEVFTFLKNNSSGGLTSGSS